MKCCLPLIDIDFHLGLAASSNNLEAVSSLGSSGQIVFADILPLYLPTRISSALTKGIELPTGLSLRGLDPFGQPARDALPHGGELSVFGTHTCADRYVFRSKITGLIPSWLHAPDAAGKCLDVLPNLEGRPSFQFPTVQPSSLPQIALPLGFSSCLKACSAVCCVDAEAVARGPSATGQGDKTTPPAISNGLTKAAQTRIVPVQVSSQMP